MFTIRQYGSGLPILCLPGATGNHRIFEPLAQQLGDRYRLIACDHPQTALDTYLYELDQLVDEHEIKAIFGTSVGGFIAQLYQSQYENNIDTIILSNTYHEPYTLQRQNKWTIRVARILPWSLVRWHLKRRITGETRGLSNHQLFSEIISSELDNMSKKEYITRLDWTMKTDREAEPLHIPILQISTQDDPVISHEQVETLKDKHNQVSTVSFQSGGHFPYFFHAEQLAITINGFLEQNMNN